MQSLRSELASKPLPKDWLVANFVTDTVGRLAIGGSSRPLSNEVDKASLLAYRDRAEAVLTTASTAAAEQYHGIANKALALVSRDASFDNIPAVTEVDKLVFLITERSARKSTEEKYARDNLYVISLRKFSARKIRRALKIRGFRKIVLEAGVTFTTFMLQGRAVSELALSVTGLSGAFREADATAFLRHFEGFDFKLQTLEQHGDTALTTWSASAKKN